MIFLRSYSEQAPTIHNVAKIDCKIAWTMILTKSGITADKNMLKQRKKMEIYFTEPSALKILAVCHLYTVLWLSLLLITCWLFWRGCEILMTYITKIFFLAESNADIYKSNDTHAPKNTPSQTEVFRCGTPSNSEVNRIALQRRTDYGNAIRKHMARPKSAGEFFCELLIISLTHCILNRLSHTIYWKNPISILGTPGYEIYIFLEKNG